MALVGPAGMLIGKGTGTVRGGHRNLDGGYGGPAGVIEPLRGSAGKASRRSRMSWGIPCLLTMLVAVPVQAAEPEGVSHSAESKYPPVTVLDLSGRSFSGRLIQMSVPGTIRLDAGGKTLEIQTNQAIWLGLDPRPEADPRLVQWFSDPPVQIRNKPKLAMEIRLVLRDGQVLAGSLQDPRRPDTLAIQHRVLGSMELPLTQLREVRIQAAPMTSTKGNIPAETQAATFDVLWLANGDRIEGILRSLAPEKTSLELASGEQTQMPTASVQAIRLAEVAGPASAPASQPTTSAWLRLRSGERVAAMNVGWDPRHAAVTFDYQGRPITLPADSLAGIEPTTGRWQWLSDLAPAGYEHQPMLAPPLRWQADATVSGAPAFWNAARVLHGIGMPLGSTIRYNLGGRYSRLVVWPILDDSTKQDGACKARVLVDGQVAWKGTVKAASPSAAVSIDLAGKQELVLQVEAQEDGDVLNRFVWAWPALAH